MKNAMTADQSAILQQFLSLPDPTYAAIFEAQAERDDLAEQMEIKTSEFDALQDECRDMRMEADTLQARIGELQNALADALSWVSESIEGEPQGNAEYLRLYKIL